MKSGGGDDIHAAARSGDLKTLESILSSNPLALNSRDKHSRTPLHLAAWAGQEPVVNYLCKLKVDVGAAAMDDMNAIHFAAQKGHLDIVRTLLSSGASIKASNRKGLTPLHFAVQGFHLELIKYLLKKGASLTARTKVGKTPLDFAKSEEILSLLGEFGQSPPDVDKNNVKKGQKSDFKSSLENKAGSSCDETATAELGTQKDETAKRRGEENDDKEALPEAKRARVVLPHLLSDDQEDEKST